MQQIGQSQSQVIENDQNQFLSEYLQYQSCPFCSRSFFRGKLAYHLKLCNSQNPMIKNSKIASRHIKNSLSAANHYQRCINCNSRIPSFLAQKHKQNCSSTKDQKTKKSNITKDSFKFEEGTPDETRFPKIRNYASQDNAKPTKRIIINSYNPKSIKIRQQLRCLRIAQEVQKIQCEYCGRKFSKQAAQRHIPICNIIKQKQRKQIVFTNNGKDIRNQATKYKLTKLEGLGKSYQVIPAKAQTSSKIFNESTTMQLKQPQNDEFQGKMANPQGEQNGKYLQCKQVEQK